MPFLSASALGDDPEGMALLRSVLASSRPASPRPKLDPGASGFINEAGVRTNG